MSSSKRSESRSEIAEFFAGKSVFITGAAGFLGVVLLEIMLRCCPEIKGIYILLRPKKGVHPQDRKQVIFRKNIFYEVRKKQELVDKVTVVPGDATHHRLGLNEDDYKRITEEVSIVFHCAAAISFLKPLRFILQNNVIAVESVVELCRNLKKLDVFVYTSTAYSNSNRKVIEEDIYDLPFSVDEVLEATRNGDDVQLDHLFRSCHPKFPNFYTFSKCIAENLLAQKAKDLPIAIVRPSIILCTWKGILPGFVEEGSGMVAMALGVGKGFIRVLHCDPEKRMDHVPVDVVANAHMIAAWSIATKRPSEYVFNCVSSPVKPCTWQHYKNVLMDLSTKNPLPKSYQKPSLILCNGPTKYWFFAMIEHFAPALVVDLLLLVTGNKPRLFSLYLFFQKAISSMLPFCINDWDFCDKNFKQLSKIVSSHDQELFYVDLNGYSVEELAKVIISGAPFYKWDIDKKSFEVRMRTAYSRYLLTSFIKWSLLGSLVLLFYTIVV